jgi:PAS domain S-box-containing protein
MPPAWGAWRLRNHSFDIILLDLGAAGGPGAEPILQLQAHAPHVPIIVLVEGEDDSRAVQAVQMGVQDCLIREQMTAALLAHAVRHAVERKKAERLLQAAERRYRTIFENSAVAIMMADTDERLVSWNRFTERLLGMGEDQLRGREVRTLYPPAEWLRLRALNTAARDAAPPETKMVRGRPGHRRHLLSVVRTPTVGPGSVGVVQDITDAKPHPRNSDRKQKNLRRFRRRALRMLLVDEQAIVRANDTVRQISGLNRHHRPASVCAGLPEAAGRRGSRRRRPCEMPAADHRAEADVRAALRGVGCGRWGRRTPLPLWLAASVVPVHIEWSRGRAARRHRAQGRRRIATPWR